VRGIDARNPWFLYPELHRIFEIHYRAGGMKLAAIALQYSPVCMTADAYRSKARALGIRAPSDQVALRKMLVPPHLVAMLRGEARPIEVDPTPEEIEQRKRILRCA